jgi:hypothetical protein
MAKAGADFTGLVVPLFHSVLISRVREEFHTAVEEFDAVLQSDRLSDSNLGTSHEYIVPLYISVGTPKEIESNIEQSHKAAEPELCPPKNLLAFPPLAYLMNTLIVTLNTIRYVSLGNTHFRY